MYRLMVAMLLANFICVNAMAEEAPLNGLPDAPPQTQTSSPPTATAPTKTIQAGVGMVLTLEKKSVIFPDLATQRTHFTGWDKCKLAANTSVAPSTVAAALLGAAVGQMRNTPHGYHQGWEGYGKRFGADLARSASYNAFGPCLIATATHEDPRFFVRDHLGFKEALKYAAVRLVFTRSDSGEKVFNYSGIGGSLAAEGLANLYYPAGSRNFGDTMIRFSLDMATRYGGHMLRQYMPVIDHRLRLSAQANGSQPDTTR
jgi:hypothetical protein